MTISLVIAKFSGLFQVFKVYVDWGSTTWHFCSPRTIKLITSNIKLVLDSLSWWDFGFVRKETNFLLTIWSVGWQFVILISQNGFFSNFLQVRDGRALCLPYSQYCLKNKIFFKKKHQRYMVFHYFFMLHAASCALLVCLVLSEDFIDYNNHVIFT